MCASRPESPWAWLPDHWRTWVAELGERPFHGPQIFKWIHRRGVLSSEGMTDLSNRLRDSVDTLLGQAPCSVAHAHRSSDATRKLLVTFDDEKTVETVLIPQLELVGPGEDADPRFPGRRIGGRVTQCVSSQVGCAMACGFCASGVAGLKRHLSAHEIVGQLMSGRQHLMSHEVQRCVVFMGMGEPLHNYGAVKGALDVMTHADGMAFSPGKVTVSTSGLVPQIDQLAKDYGGAIQLAVSLHAVNDRDRTALMPINRRYPLDDLVAALERYPLKRRRRITVEYTLIDGVNDGVAEAKGLVRLLRRVPIAVNLIPMNPVEGSGYGAPRWEVVKRFQRAVRDEGIHCFVRTQRGDSIAAACGQLALEGETPKVRLRLKRQVPEGPLSDAADRRAFSPA